jgi:hypothetical protein
MPAPTAKVLKKKTVMLSMAVFFSCQSFSVIPNPSLTFVAYDIIDICI